MINKPESCSGICFAVLLHLNSKSPFRPIWWSQEVPSNLNDVVILSICLTSASNKLNIEVGHYCWGKMKQNTHQKTNSKYSRQHDVSKHTHTHTLYDKQIWDFTCFPERLKFRYLIKNVRKFALLIIFSIVRKLTQNQTKTITKKSFNAQELS